MSVRSWLPLRRSDPPRPIPAHDTGTPTFAFEDVTVLAGARPILTDLSVTVPASGVTVITGPSGAGKSTLARLCNRLIDPTVGSVRFRGADVKELDVLALRRAVGLVFQRPTVFPGTVADNLAATGVIDRTRWVEQLRSVRLDPDLVLDQDASTLSGGEAQRVCMVRALLLAPEVLVADEATASVDAETTEHLEALVRDLAGGGLPVVWVTHDLAQLRRIADHVVVMRDGAIVAQGPVSSVLAEMEPGLRRLLGTPERSAEDDGGR